MINSRHWLTCRVISNLLILSACLTQTSLATAASLRDLALGKELFIGTAVKDGTSLTTRDQGAYGNTVRKQFQILTPENHMKMQFLQPQRGQFDFREADAIVNFAQSNRQQVHGHTLLWYQQFPSWVGNIPCGERLNVMKDHVRRVMGHFKGKIVSWDVANEVIAESGGIRPSVWNCNNTNFDNMVDILDQVFRVARETDPSALLCYNDYNAENVNAKFNGVYRLVSALKNKGAPIDCVGHQMHAVSNYPSASGLSDVMNRYESLGLLNFITELDVRFNNGSFNGTQQANQYRNYLKACLDRKSCVRFTLWGFTDKYSWVPNTFPGQGQALIYGNNIVSDEDGDLSYNKKPAFDAILSTLRDYNVSRNELFKDTQLAGFAVKKVVSPASSRQILNDIIARGYNFSLNNESCHNSPIVNLEELLTSHPGYQGIRGCAYQLASLGKVQLLVGGTNNEFITLRYWERNSSTPIDGLIYRSINNSNLINAESVHLIPWSFSFNFNPNTAQPPRDVPRFGLWLKNQGKYYFREFDAKGLDNKGFPIPEEIRQFYPEVFTGQNAIILNETD